MPQKHRTRALPITASFPLAWSPPASSSSLTEGMSSARSIPKFRPIPSWIPPSLIPNNSSRSTSTKRLRELFCSQCKSLQDLCLLHFLGDFREQVCRSCPLAAGGLQGLVPP